MPEGLNFLDSLLILGNDSIWKLIFFLYQWGGWILIYAMFFFATFELNRHFKVHHYLHKFKWIFLAVDVPKDNEQTPRAVENIFVHLAGAHATRDLVEKFWNGEIQRWFSFEIISIEGYIQFVIVTEKKHKELIEALVYAQYPDAQITEIEDYAAWAPEKYPNSEYKAWGTEWELNVKYIYPLRTWEDFEDKVTGDYKDPMAATLETFTKVGPGEQAWLQILVRPIGQRWKNEGLERIAEIQGRAEHKQPWYLKLISWPVKSAESIYQYALSGEIQTEDDKKKDKLEFGALILRPSDIGEIKAIESKITRIGFNVKMRFVYIARLENFNKSKLHYPIIGAMKQYTDEYGNALKPNTKRSMTTAHYLFSEMRKNLKRGTIVKNYKNRDIWRGVPRFILNVRELASIWHFPMEGVRVPSLKRVEVKTSRPPVELPFGREYDLEFEDGYVKGRIPIPKHLEKRRNTEYSVTYGGVKIKGDEYAMGKQESAIEKASEKDDTTDVNQKRNAPPPNLPTI